MAYKAGAFKRMYSRYHKKITPPNGKTNKTKPQLKSKEPGLNLNLFTEQSFVILSKGLTIFLFYFVHPQNGVYKNGTLF